MHTVLVDLRYFGPLLSDGREGKPKILQLLDGETGDLGNGVHQTTGSRLKILWFGLVAASFDLIDYP